MTLIFILHLGLQGIAFVIWAFFMFSMLFRLTRRSLIRNAEAGGGYFAWVSQSLKAFGEAATSQEDRPLRLKIVRSGLILILLIALTPFVASLGR